MALLRFSTWLVALWLLACSGSTDRKPDASVPGTDAGDHGNGSGNGGPGRQRFDGGQVLGDAVKPCDPFEPDQCAAGEECDVVLRRNPTAQDFEIYTGCVQLRNERGEGDPCVPWNDFATPYVVSGLFDEVHTDPCEQGLLCASDPDVRGLFTCQRSCQSGRYGDQGFSRHACESAAEYCTGADRYREVCMASDGCDPSDPSGCGPGRSCYLRTNDLSDGVLSVCLPLPPEDQAVDDGEPCQFFNDCHAGSVCWGPVRVPPTAWTAENVVCRSVCSLAAEPAKDGGSGDVSDEDAGADEVSDGAVPDSEDSGGCSGSARCVPFEASGLTLGTIDGEFGQCE